ncbi:oxysterol-binding protein-related protein 4C isoform X2 [Vigna radiata var. radiata]|uniref:Oxysterol-binding protein-related protein 4C isoform X2 n=1 Tax=Vigna radiata var. radiata TaxID=3916 RepID=A0A1S3UIZ9_VIGRR|nr:oxysterol-binding protein-related protein 4C isoform X2 [Vigna radiata var. radiata]XP_014506007.1 oxysterol-binding protein-related protein 4C isoform X2 [Vigna radiata var. radiata]XP_022639632.1 oxysterol-binding protein-related protein 4C isoform X2 [Vigna radiata var. radiata]
MFKVRWEMEVAKGKEAKKIVLTKPFSIEGESDAEPFYRAPNLLRRLLSLLKNVRPGSDLTNFQLPPVFNLPKSQLQCYGESVYCTSSNLLSKCNSEQSPVDRFTSVVAWSISTTRPSSFGVAPYNPILGETHHVSKGYLNVLLEQVSVNPPVSALHATDEKENIEMIWWQQPVPKFRGTSIETEVHGKRMLKLLNHGETYEMNCPRLSIRILPVPRMDWVGNVNIRCPETGLVAEISYTSSYSLLGFGGNRKLIKGKILDPSLFKVLYEVDGHWDKTVQVKDTTSGEVRVIYDAKEVISGLKTPIIKNAEDVLTSESAVVWGELSEAIMRNEWEKAREEKEGVEEREKKMVRERGMKGESWVPKNFRVSYSKDTREWNCSPIHKWVPAAPIIAP